MALYRENATGFLGEWASNPGAGYTAISAQPTDTIANRVNWWRAVDTYGQTSVWHPSLQGGYERPAPPGTAGSGVNIMSARYSSFEEPDGLPGLYLVNMSAARNSGGYNGAYKLSLTATAVNGEAYLTPLSNVYNIKLTQDLRWIVSLYVSPASSGEKAFSVLVKTSGAGTVYSLNFTTGATAGQWTRVFAELDLRADTSVGAMLGIKIPISGVRIDVDAIMIEELVGDTVAPSAYFAPLNYFDGAQIVNGSITGTEIASATITGANIANATIDGSKIQSATITAANIASLTITASQIANLSITGGKIADATIDNAKIISLSATKLTAGIIDASNISVTNLNATNITAGVLNVARINAGSLVTNKLANNSVTNIIAGTQSSQVSQTIGETVTVVNPTIPAVASGDRQSVTVFGTISIQQYGATTSSVMLRFLRNGVVQYTQYGYAVASGSYEVPVSGTWTDLSPPSAATTYSVTVYLTGVSGSLWYWRGSAVVLEARR